MLHTEIIAIFSEIHTENVSAMCGNNIQFLSTKPGGI